MTDKISIGITLGDNQSFAITEGNDLVLCHTNPVQGHGPVIANLGPCTKARIEALQDYLGRLKIHAS
jgi:hypothetical protein